MLSSCLENTVAIININVVIIKYIFPNILLIMLVSALVSGIIDLINIAISLDNADTVTAIEIAIAISFNEISFLDQ